MLPAKADIIVRADYVLKMDRDFTLIKNGAIAVKDKKIAFVGADEEVAAKYTSDTIIGGSGKVAFPGLVNTHTHAAMVYFRGLADDLPLKVWLEEYIWPAEGKWLSPEFVGDAVELACVEMLKAGVTVYNDMYFFGDAIAGSTKKAGMRAVVGVGILDFPSKSAGTTEEYFANAENFIKAWAGDELIVPGIAPHAPYTCSPDNMLRAKKIAEQYNAPLHVHLSETRWEVEEIKSRYGKTPIAMLDSIGFLDKRVLAAHCVWPTDEEIEILAARKVGVAHCIESNLKLASGIAPVTKMLKAGVKVTFGTDSAASNNDLNILSEMSTAAKVHKAVSGDPTALDAKQVMLMATRWGAEALGLGNITGSLEEGKAADIVVADLKKPHLVPLYDIYSHIVYSMNPSDIETVLVNGRVVLDKGQLTSADESEILHKAQWWGQKISSAKTG
ncbi:MAG: S-adenosylhomocysteine deaminase [Nitrospira bacterium HGW-Nitrospira-1]|nr:MAG: S-adenosylhomocysteine deaminase [Nitrospira bacterium HGW-Nitrospira-1]